MEIALAAVVGALCLVCFVIGARIGQAASKGEKIVTPSINPLKVHKEHQARKEAEMEQNRLDIILQNIEKYDGTGRGQADVPGR